MIALKHDIIRPYGHTDTTKKEEVEHMFDNIAHRYDFLNHLLSAGIDHTWRKKAVNFIGEIQPKRKRFNVTKKVKKIAINKLKCQKNE